MSAQRTFRVALGLAILAGCAAQPPAAPTPPTSPPVALRPTATLPPLPATALPPTLTPPATLTPPPTSTPSPALTPATAPLRIGVQAGHWKAEELPDELARFRTSTGAFAGGVGEAEVNLDIAQRVVALLLAQGIQAELLPATIPIDYKADALISIHADGSAAGQARGFKMATPWRTSKASQHLLEALMAEYAVGTQLPESHAITVNMRGFYAFNYRRHRHASAKTTPAVIIEMGYLSNSTDRAFMLNQQDRIAQSITKGLLRYLDGYDRNDQAALVPQEFALHRFTAAGVTIHAAPAADASVLFIATDEQRFLPFREQNGWYEGFVRGQSRAIGWVRKDQLIATDEAVTVPTPSGN